MVRVRRWRKFVEGDGTISCGVGSWRMCVFGGCYGKVIDDDGGA